MSDVVISWMKRSVLGVLLLTMLGCMSSLPEPPEMIEVGPGWFEMGRSYDEEGDVDELPAHKVYLDAYTIAKYPVTNEQLAVILNWALSKGYLQDSEGNTYDGGEIFAYGKPIADPMASGPGSQITYTVGRFDVLDRVIHGNKEVSMGNHPAISITWYGAVAYCNWLSEMSRLRPCYDTATWERITPLPNGYRLPTEAEWERAAAWDAAASDEGKHWRYGVSSNTLDITQANFFDNEYTNPQGLAAMPFTAPVGWYNGENPARLKEPEQKTKISVSPIGCFDMAGNTWEWCHDWYQDDYYTYSGLTNPTGPETGIYRICRGGSWRYSKNHCRAADRYWNWPDYRSPYQGFRLAISPSRTRR